MRCIGKRCGGVRHAPRFDAALGLAHWTKFRLTDAGGSRISGVSKSLGERLADSRGKTVGGLLAVSRAIDAFSYKVGVVANYLVLFAALLSAANAGVRYGLNGLILLSRDYQFLSGIQT